VRPVRVPDRRPRGRGLVVGAFSMSRTAGPVIDGR
jgi:hypothetical protein